MSSSAVSASSTPSILTSLKRGVLWNYGGIFFFYFVIWQLAFTFLPLWLDQEAQMNPANIGLVNTVMAVTALCLQPLYGYIQDRLGSRKPLFAWVVVCAALVGPFFQFVFLPLTGINMTLGAVAGGIFLSLVLLSGVSVVEAFNERASRANGFEYGHARLFGSLGGGTAALVGGIIWAQNPGNVWWAASLSAIVLGVLLFLAKVPKTAEAQARVEKSQGGVDAAPTISKDTIKTLLTDRSFIGFVVLMFGTAALYDVFDQQFPIYFADLADSGDPEQLFSRVVSIQIFTEAAVMLVAPWFVNKIGAKAGLQLFAAILVVRVVGSALITNTEALITWRLLAAVEMPLMLVSVMKYITRMFNVNISATAYMLGFGVAKSLGVAVFSYGFGRSYEAVGFSTSYLIMGGVVVTVTLLASVLMRNDRGKLAPGESGAGADSGPGEAEAGKDEPVLEPAAGPAVKAQGDAQLDLDPEKPRGETPRDDASTR